MSGPSIQPFFVVNPDYMSWEDWNGNVIISYGEFNLPYNTEENWQETAKVLTSNTSLSTYPVPHPDGYDDWRKWARDFTEIINGQSY